MVERVRIEPTRIVLKDASNNIKFDTNNYYLKTDAGGTLKVGGYTRAPTVYGSGNANIVDRGYGGFASAIVGNTANLTAQSQDFVFQISIPKSTVTKYFYGNSWAATGSSNMYQSTKRPLIFNGYNTDGSVTATRLGSYFWQTAERLGGATDSYGNPIGSSCLFMQFVDNNNQPMANLPAVSTSGYINFSVNRTDAQTWSGSVQVNDGYSISTVVQPFSRVIGGLPDSYGNIYWQPAYILPMLFLSENTPTSLAIMRTA